MPREKPDYGTIAGKTAIARRAVSVPTRELIAAGRIPKGASVLNHGRGRADADAAALQAAAGDYAEFDPNHAPNPEALERRYDVVVSNYVMNVLPPDLRKGVWEQVAACTGGVAYITVRSTGDVSIKGKRYRDGVITPKGTFQKPYTATALTREAKKVFNSVEVIMGRPNGISWTIAASDPKVAGPGEPETPQQKPAQNGQQPTQPGHVDDGFEDELADIKRRAGIT